MIRTIAKIGESQGIIFDAELLQLTRLKVGDEVSVEVQPDGAITIAPMHREVIGPEAAAATARRLIKKMTTSFVACREQAVQTSDGRSRAGDSCGSARRSWRW